MMPNNSTTRDVDVLNTVISALEKLDSDDRARVLQTVSTFFDVSRRSEGVIVGQDVQKSHRPLPNVPTVQYSEDLAQPPKDFLLEKLPHTDVERIACLAYYLTHYRDTPFFKTLDLSKINTEAAQPKFSNSANSANNAVKMGYLVAATSNRRQLSAGGEQFVQALPDRDLAKKMMASFRPRKRVRKKLIKGQIHK